jgi:hypothetical protein
MPPAAAALATLGGGSALAGGLMVGSGVASAASSLQGNRNQRSRQKNKMRCLHN